MRLEAKLFTLNPATDPEGKGKECPGCIDVLFALQEAGITPNQECVIGEHRIRIEHHPTVRWMFQGIEEKNF